MHTEYGYLGFHNLLGVIKPQAWWHILNQDLQNHSLYYLHYQIAKGQLFALEYESPQYIINSSLQNFKRWGINLIRLSLTTPNGNQWIITVIDYMTGWPITKTVKDMNAEMMIDFLVQEIFMYYAPHKELLSDNSTNLLANIVKYYLAKIFSNLIIIHSSLLKTGNDNITRTYGRF